MIFLYVNYVNVGELPDKKRGTMHINEENNDMQRAIKDKQRFARIASVEAKLLFGEILRDLCKKAGITQDELESESEQYKEYLVETYTVIPPERMGGFKQSAVSRVIQGKQPPTYAQVYVWWKILHGRLGDTGLPKDLRDDMYYLNGYTPPEGIVAAYYRHADKPPQ